MIAISSFMAYHKQLRVFYQQGQLLKAVPQPLFFPPTSAS